MKQLVVVVLVSGCWSSAQPGAQPGAEPEAEVAAAPAPPAKAAPAREVADAPALADGQEHDAAYGGATYGTAPHAGVLGSAALQQGGAFASLTGTGDFSSEMADVYGGLDADTAGAGGLLGNPASVATARLGEATVTGDLDKAIIRRYMRRNLQKVQYCYEKQLLATAGISGTLKAELTIGADGKVASASATGVHANVAACVATAIKAIQFPKPKDGRVVRVAYPFVFAPAGDAHGYGGLGLRGTGAGGGGTGYGTIGIGSYGTIGHGSGTGAGYGGIGIGLRRGGPKAQLGQPTTRGSLDKAIIRRYVRRHLNKITYCYERQLLRTPKLAGKLTAKFVIETDGTVTIDRVSGLHADVDACVARVIEQIQFAKPSGGGTVTVSYPFTFAPGAAGPAAQRGTLKVLGSAGDGADAYGGSLDGGFGIGRSDPSAVGGGGTGWGTIGTGSYGTIGTGAGYGVGGVRTAPKTSTAKLGDAKTTGTLDKAIIRRYVRRNLQKLRFCYEQQLLQTPKLAGTVTATFTIGADGKVASSTAIGLHPDVDACVARLLGGIEFPKPTGGGAVLVTYPFTFAAAPDDAKQP